MARKVKTNSLGSLTFCCLFIASCYGSVMVCSECDNGNAENVTSYCKNHNTTGSLYINGSCCVNKTDSTVQILGLDWSSCNLKTFPVNISSLVELQLFLLEDNPDLTVTAEDYIGLTQLQYLSLPSHLPCPGGNSSWRSEAVNGTVRMCEEEQNLCLNKNVTCPNNNSHCLLIGPGQMNCLCNSGYHGYKCLRKGEFPTWPFAIGIIGGTLVVSVFLWCTQRRKVTKVHLH